MPSIQQLDMFEQPPAEKAKAYPSEYICGDKPWTPPKDGTAFFKAAQELIHFTAYLALNDWQQKVLWPHLQNLLKRIEKETRPEILWFELGYIISAMEIEQLRSRSAALDICKRHGVTL